MTLPNLKGLQALTRVPMRANIIPAAEYGLVGDGSDETTKLNNAAMAAAAVKGVLALEGGKIYGTTLPIPSLSDFAIQGIGGKATIKLLATAQWVFSQNMVYNNLLLDSLILDANSRAGFGNNLVTFNDCRNIRLRSVEFRDRSPGGYALYLQAAKQIELYDCDFWGTVAGVIGAGAQDPTPVSGALYRSGMNIGTSCEDIYVHRSRFNFCHSGLLSNVILGEYARNVRVSKCNFRGDWWASPFITARFTPTAYNSGTGLVTVAGGGMTAAFPAGGYRTMAVPQVITSGSSFSNIYAGEVDSSVSFASVQVGDIIETVDGKRAEVASVKSADSIWVKRWESIDTFEPTTPPALATAWRIIRIFAMTGNSTSDTTVQLYQLDFVNPHSGAYLVADAALTPVGVVCRSYAKTEYSGIHINGYIKGLTIDDNDLQGSWADQISIFDTEAPQVLNNRIAYTQDEGITLTRCVGAIAKGNRGKHLGVSLLFYGDSHQAIISENHCDTWGLINNGARLIGGIEGGGLNVAILGNSFKNNGSQGASRNSPIAISLRFDNVPCDGTIIAGNVDAGGRDFSLYLSNSIGQVYQRDFAGPRIGGAGKHMGISQFSHTATRPVTSNDIAHEVLDQDGNQKLVIFGSGTTQLQSLPATAGVQSQNSSALALGSARWNGTASVGEAIYWVVQRASSAAGDYALVFYNQLDVEVARLRPDGRLITLPTWARVYHNTTQSLTTAVQTALAFNSERDDTDTIHDNATNNTRLTCKTAGIYDIKAQVEFASNSTGLRQVDIKLNGTTALISEIHTAINGDVTRINVATSYRLAVNDYVECLALQTSGGNLNVVSNGNVSPEFTMERVG